MEGRGNAFFGEYRYCASCKKLLPTEYEFDMCPICIENELFKEVREYIRSHDVNEQDVADHFNLPLSRVRGWIHEGRIQYKENRDGKTIGHHCARCGLLIMRGEFCRDCRMYLKTHKGMATKLAYGDEDTRMRYYDTEEN